MSDESRTQYTFDDPTTRYPKIEPPEQTQAEPGIQSEMTPVPDIGEKTYTGSGRLTGRKALVTGADSGIGAAVALAFAREGADVTMSYLPEEESDADHVASLIEEAGRTAVRVPGDITDAAHCRALVDAAVEGMGGLDIVVNVAGKQVSQKDVLDITDEQFDLTFKTNVYAAFWIIKAALPHLPAGATIINTASLEAWQPAPIRVDYASTKGAINNLSKAIALQVAPKGIRVNVVAPGPTWSALQVSSGVPTEDLPEFGSETALGRAGQPAEIAPVYVFLASPESSFVVGATYAVTGGMPTP